MKTGTEQTVEIEANAAFLRVWRMVHSHMHYLIDGEWGPRGPHGRCLILNEGAKVRIAQIFGWIAALWQTDHRDLANKAAESIVGHLDQLTGASHETEEQRRSATTGPDYIYELSDDGSLHGFSYFRCVRADLCRDLDPENNPRHRPRRHVFNVHPSGMPWPVDLEFKYVIDYNGGLLYHGPGRGQVFSVTLNPCLWAMHS